VISNSNAVNDVIVFIVYLVLSCLKVEIIYDFGLDKLCNENRNELNENMNNKEKSSMKVQLFI
jgi:hypothetical protein